MSFIDAVTDTITHDERAIVINGQRKLIISGSIHYPRSTPEMWPDLIRKAKEGGLNAIETYVFWNAHEPVRRQYDFEGRLDLVRFLKTIHDEGLYSILRIGPYVCAEWNFGGLPVWLNQLPNVELRTDNQVYENEMANFTTLIVNMIQQEKLLASQGGPIIIAQINTCNGFYCDDFKPNNATSPKMWTENWTGWFKNWGGYQPYRPAEDVAYSVARFYQRQGTMQNYYMYHGGTNFARTSGGPYITTSYDYDAPIDEYGNLRQPKWGHLKELHESLYAMENALLYGDVIHTDHGNGVWSSNYSAPGVSAGCFLCNTNSQNDSSLSFNGNTYFLPAWSVSVLPDCKTEAHNTAKINSQTSLMVNVPNTADNEPSGLSWSWRSEMLRDVLHGNGGQFKSNELKEQLSVTADATDYLWYMTRIYLDPKGPNFSTKMTLRVNFKGHGLYAFVNGKFVGSLYNMSGGLLEQTATVKAGMNHVTLLTSTVGLTNYGSHYENFQVGIAGGPVQLVSGNTTWDLSSNEWSYKIGLDGETREIYAKEHVKWFHDDVPVRRPFTWYKTTFKAPIGDEPVVVDLNGMSKGVAYVNGKSLGRFWPTQTASQTGCSDCSYKGPYSPSKCQANCGQPTQRWYHVPRSFLETAENNTLVLFEEAGGDPLQVSFQTVTAGTVCANLEEGHTMSLACQGGHTISSVDFASFGNPQGTCGSFSNGICGDDIALSIVRQVRFVFTEGIYEP
ncbi:Beta-galactosidase 7 [Acorus calamus]|uniref:beta-galactosidase n=1 Tax=Acorus calamus TaxID=4465 RepID=A0AAV9CKX0_ACOCL|nr:Beta-galactosidase 7 [Acorus calamus]